MNALPIFVTLILVGLAVGVWHGLQWLFGWDGIGLAIATLVLTGTIFQSTDSVLGAIFNREEGEKPTDPKP
jgi:hypothetical protein